MQFLYIAKGSLSELDTQLELAKGLGFVLRGMGSLDRNVNIDKMISGLIRHQKGVNTDMKIIDHKAACYSFTLLPTFLLLTFHF